MEVFEDLVIVGSGIGGVATALGFHILGLRSLVLESADSLRASGFSLTQWSNAWQATDALGVGDLLRQHGTQLRRRCPSKAIASCASMVISTTFVNVKKMHLSRGLGSPSAERTETTNSGSHRPRPPPSFPPPPPSSDDVSDSEFVGGNRGTDAGPWKQPRMDFPRFSGEDPLSWKRQSSSLSATESPASRGWATPPSISMDLLSGGTGDAT
ncbi:3-hydroxybenzoate 6-hydroxylase 1 [Nymphaea thermarum]|nr:3-hydroxybenzoate 6-hydroxylase 1 [Nymphaea thermarum]